MEVLFLCPNDSQFYFTCHPHHTTPIQDIDYQGGGMLLAMSQQGLLGEELQR